MIYHSQWSMSLRLYETGHWRVIQRPRPLRNPRTRALGISSLVPPTLICRKARDPRDRKYIDRKYKTGLEGIIEHFRDPCVNFRHLVGKILDSYRHLS